MVNADHRPSRVAADDLPSFARAMNRHFHEPEEDAEVLPLVRAMATDYRAWWVRDQGRVVGNLGVIETDLSLPGGRRLPVAAVTAVGVAQTMRRRGLLRSMMHAAMDEAVERGEALAVLYASESAIYGRFGFGPAVDHVAYAIDRTRMRFHDPVDVRLVREVTADAAAARWPAIHDAVRAARGGVVGITDGMWRLAVLEDAPSWREGTTTRRLVEVADRGYARYRIDTGEEDPIPQGTVVLEELVAADPEAESALWQHVCDIDLTTRTTTWLRPVDDALPWMVTEPHALHARTGPPVFARVLDVPRMFTERGYGQAGRAVFEVVDPEGRAGGVWHLHAGPDGAECTASTRSPELVVPVQVLGALVLGSVRATTLLAARRIEEARAGAAADLDRLLTVDRAPWTTVEF